MLQRWCALPRVAAASLVLACLACASVGDRTSSSIDGVDVRGHMFSLATLRGQVVLLDVCVSTNQVCNVNAAILDEAWLAFPGQDVTVVSLLLDEDPFGQAALRAYPDDLGIKHLTLIASQRVRDGQSGLGPTNYIPRFVVIDREGDIVLDDAGGVLNVEGVVNRVRPLIRR